MAEAGIDIETEAGATPVGTVDCCTVTATEVGLEGFEVEIDELAAKIFETDSALVEVVVGWLCRSAEISLCLSALQVDSERLR